MAALVMSGALQTPLATKARKMSFWNGILPAQKERLLWQQATGSNQAGLVSCRLNGNHI